MLVALVHSSLPTSLRKIRVFIHEDCLNWSWWDLQNFLESNSSKIIRSLKYMASKISKNPMQIIDLLKFMHSNTLQYKEKSQQDLIKDYITTCWSIYETMIEKESRNCDDEFIQTPETNNVLRDLDLSKEYIQYDLEQEKINSQAESDNRIPITQEIYDAYRHTPDQSFSVHNDSSITSNEEKAAHWDSVISSEDHKSIQTKNDFNDDKFVIFKRGRLDAKSQANIE